MYDLENEFEALMEEQFRLDLISDKQVENQEFYDEAMWQCEQNINAGINDCLYRMNKRR